MRFTEPAMRPPQEQRSLLLRATQGCTWNKCNFCYVSRGYPFAWVPREQFEEDAIAFKHYFPDNTRIYLTGSNPFTLPSDILKEYLDILRRHYPMFDRASMQARIDDIEKKTDEELISLKELGLSHLYIGTENGNEEVLKLMNKGHTAKDTVRELKRLDDAGITYTNFYVLGLGGKGKGVASGEATAAMFNQVRPVRITTTGMTIFPNTPVAAMVEAGEFVEASEREKIEELHAFLSALKIDVWYDGIHYLNPVNYRFKNSDLSAKEHALADIEDILRTCSDEELERMVNRSQMHSL